MKIIKRFYDEDLRNMIMEKYDVKPSQVTSVYTEECRGYGMDEHTEPVFYIELEEEGE